MVFQSILQNVFALLSSSIPYIRLCKRPRDVTCKSQSHENIYWDALLDVILDFFCTTSGFSTLKIKFRASACELQRWCLDRFPYVSSRQNNIKAERHTFIQSRLEETCVIFIRLLAKN